MILYPCQHRQVYSGTYGYWLELPRHPLLQDLNGRSHHWHVHTHCFLCGMLRLGCMAQVSGGGGMCVCVCGWAFAVVFVYVFRFVLRRMSTPASPHLDIFLCFCIMCVCMCVCLFVCLFVCLLSLAPNWVHRHTIEYAHSCAMVLCFVLVFGLGLGSPPFQFRSVLVCPFHCLLPPGR